MIVDIHVHPTLMRREKVDLEAFKEMVEAARNAGIDKLVLLGMSTLEQFSEMKKMVLGHPDMVVPFFRGICFDPEGVASLEKAVREFGWRGMKIAHESSWPRDDPYHRTPFLACHALIRKAGELKIPVVFHPPPLPVIPKIAQQCPDTTLIFAHVGYYWDKAFKDAKPYKNICFDTSGFDPIMDVVEKGVEVLGPERLLFGSDAPGRNFIAQLAKVQYADISKRDKELISGGNAVRLLNMR